MTTDLTTLSNRQLQNRVSGARTQLKRHAGGPRELELRSYLETLQGILERRPIETRLAELDARWERLVDDAATMIKPADCRLIQSYRNRQAGRLRRRGLPPLETISQETRRVAEDKLLRLIDSNVGAAWAQAARAEIDEASRLRDELETLQPLPF